MPADSQIVIHQDRQIDGDLINGLFRKELIVTGGREVDVSPCVQCGTCTASCELIDYMDVGPRRLMRLVKLGFIDQALKAQSLWLCTGCNLCTNRCPYGVRVSDVIECLKSLAIKKGINNNSVFYHHAYMESLNHHGVLSETGLVTRYLMGTHGIEGLKRESWLGLRLFLKGKVKLWRKSLKGLKGLKRMLAGLDQGQWQ